MVGSYPLPTNPAYRLVYDLVMIERLTWNLDLEGAKKLYP